MISDQAEEMSALIIATNTSLHAQQRFSLEILKSHLMMMMRMTRMMMNQMMTKRMTRRIGHPTSMMTRMTMSQKMMRR
jgi:hypothetical protein